MRAQKLSGAPRRRSWFPQSRYIALGMHIARLHGRLDQIERQAGMARIRWPSGEFLAKPIEQNPDGSWVMEALQHTGRTAPGTRITVKPNEIVAGTMPASGQPDTTAAPADDGQAALEAAMADERKTLASPADLIAQFQASKKDAPQGDAGAVPLGPTQAPAAAPNSEGKKMGSRLADKAKLVADGQSSLLKSAEAKLDAMLAAQKDSGERLAAATQKIAAVQADIEEGTSTIEDIANQLTNS